MTNKRRYICEKRSAFDNDDLLKKIFDYLLFTDICLAGRVCKKFEEIADHDHEMEYALVFEEMSSPGPLKCWQMENVCKFGYIYALRDGYYSQQFPTSTTMEGTGEIIPNNRLQQICANVITIEYYIHFDFYDPPPSEWFRGIETMIYNWETVYYERWCGEVMQEANEVRLNLGWPVDISWDDEYLEVTKLYINCLRWEDQKHLAEKFPNVTDLDVSIGVNPYPPNQVKSLRIGISVMGRDDNFKRRKFTLAGVEELTIVDKMERFRDWDWKSNWKQAFLNATSLKHIRFNMYHGRSTKEEMLELLPPGVEMSFIIQSN